MSHRLLLGCFSIVVFACGHSGLPRQLAESAHRDHPECRGNGIQGHVLDANAGTWSVDACGTATTYQCPTGPNSRWRTCEQVAPTSGGAVVVVAQ